MLDSKSVLVTGGTGSFGKHFISTVLRRDEPERIIVFSRDELKQHQMSRDPRFCGPNRDKIRYFIGNVRDRQRLERALDGVDIVVHAAALKQVPLCEYNPFEAIKTNVLGAQNVIDAAIERGVERVIALSTDKACNPINLYGASKLCSDKLFVAGNAYAGGQKSRFSVVRYGNVIGSRGSVIPLFLRQRPTGQLTLTDPKMTRFWLTLDQAVTFVLDSLERMEGGELFVPKIPSMRLLDLARVIGPDCEIDQVGIRPGEKLHEVMISNNDSRQTLEFDDFYIIEPQFPWWGDTCWSDAGGRAVAEDFRYSSELNSQWLSDRELAAIVEDIDRQTAEQP